MCDSDLIPERPRGRPIRRMANGLDPVSGAGKDSLKCRECPMWDRQRAWCPLRAAPCNGFATACRYGTSLIRDKRQADRRTNGK